MGKMILCAKLFFAINIPKNTNNYTDKIETSTILVLHCVSHIPIKPIKIKLIKKPSISFQFCVAFQSNKLIKLKIYTSVRTINISQSE
ncbi:MAG: hypothetical protein CM15mV18_0380 [uncultured marine virus]|nr:MAG: hypothetical protein CM15mV18_0380 [uncultured marine virus]